MNLRSDVIQRWWPTTQCLDLVEGSVEIVTAAIRAEVTRFLGGESPELSWQKFPHLDAAFETASVFCNVPTVYLVLPTRSKWSVLWYNGFLCDGYDSLCSCLTMNHGLTTIHWSAHDESTVFQPGAKFIHRRLDGALVRQRTVQAAQEDKRWHFYEIGDPLPEEELSSYMAKRKRDRLNEARMVELLARFGAFPWSEEFYAVTEQKSAVLRRVNPPKHGTIRSRSEVLEKGKSR